MKHAVSLALLLACSGCVSTRIRSFVDPAYKGTVFRRFVVLAPLSDLALRDRVERTFCKEAARLDAFVAPAIDLVPPTRARDVDKEFWRALLQEATRRRIRGIIVVILRDFDWVEVYVPPTVEAYAYSSPRSSSAGASVSGGYTVYLPTAQHRILLFDIKAGEVAWIADASSEGNKYATAWDIWKSVASKTWRELYKAGLVTERAPEKKRDARSSRPGRGDSNS